MEFGSARQLTCRKIISIVHGSEPHFELPGIVNACSPLDPIKTPRYQSFRLDLGQKIWWRHAIGQGKVSTARTISLVGRRLFDRPNGTITIENRERVVDTRVWTEPATTARVQYQFAAFVSSNHFIPELTCRKQSKGCQRQEPSEHAAMLSQISSDGNTLA